MARDRFDSVHFRQSLDSWVPTVQAPRVTGEDEVERAADQWPEPSSVESAMFTLEAVCEEQPFELAPVGADQVMVTTGAERHPLRR